MHPTHEPNRGGTAVLLFAREPHRERKPFGCARLAAEELHRRLFLRTAATARAACLRTGAPLWVALESATTRLPVPATAGRVRQRGRTFGSRIGTAIGELFDRGFDKVVVIGTDTPDLEAEDIRRAIDRPDAVIGPAPDGGCYLFSLRRSQLPELARLPWCRGNLLHELRIALSGPSGAPQELSPKADLDVRADLLRLRGQLRELRIRGALLLAPALSSARRWERGAPVRERRAVPAVLPRRGPPR